MDDENNINLQHLNKKPDSKLKTWATGLVDRKSQAGNPNRDEFGQFAGSNSLKSAQKFSRSRSMVMVGLFGLVGAIVIFRSFAATPAKLYPYQYSMYLCPNFNNAADPTGDGKNPVDYSCTDQSAESIAYRLSIGFNNAAPSSSAYSSLTQKLAGDRIAPSVVSKDLLAASSKKNLSTADYVNSMYTSLTGGVTDTAGISSWNTKLNNNQTSREIMAAELASLSKAKSYLRSKFVTFRKAMPQIAVIPTAATAQANRLTTARTLNVSVASDYNSLKTRVDNSASRTTAAELLNPKVPEDITLANVTDTEAALKDIDGWLNDVKNSTWISNINGKYGQIKTLADQAKLQAAYSPDLPDAAIQAELSSATTANTFAIGALPSVESSKTKTSAALQFTEAKYQVMLERKGLLVAASYGKQQTGLRSGIKHWMDDTYAGKRIHIVRVDLTNPKVFVRTSTYAERGQTPSQFAAASSSYVAVNGDFRDLSVSGSYMPQGLAVGNGQQWPGSSDKINTSFLACTAAKDCVIEKRLSVTPNSPTYHSVVSGDGGQSGILLEPGFEWSLKPGDEGCKLTPENTTCSDPHPRTGVGLSADRKTMWLVVVEGRQSGFTGLTFYEFKDLFKKLNAKWALNMDGGGSSSLIINGKLISGRPTSEPNERVVTNSLGLVVVP